MDIEEIKAEKRKLEEGITDKLNAFMKKTKIEVDCISMGDIIHDSATGTSGVLYVLVSLKL